MGAEFENPSAGRFASPDSSQPEGRRFRSGWRTILALFLVIYPLLEKFASQHGPRRLTLLVPLGGLVLAALDWFCFWQQANDSNGPDPYSPPTRITR